MIGHVIVANALPLLGLLLVNITQPQLAPTATFNSATVSAETAKQEIVWIVKDNETLSGIAQDYYGNLDYWTILASDNAWIKDPNLLETGWKLKLRPLPLTTENKEENLETVSKPDKKLAVAKPTPTETNNMPSPAVTTPATPPSNFDSVYIEAGEKYGIPWQVLYGLHLTETGLRDGTIYNGQGSGARGPMQFMPGTFRAYAVDGDGDGVPNIDNAKDAIHTAANYLAKHGDLYSGLVSYGGNINGTLDAARLRGLQM